MKSITYGSESPFESIAGSPCRGKFYHQPHYVVIGFIHVSHIKTCASSMLQGTSHA